MEFSVYALKNEVNAMQEASGLRFGHVPANTKLLFPASGTLVLALRQDVHLKFSEQAITLPRFCAYFVPSIETAIAAQGESSGPWLMLAASDVTWRVLLGELRRMGASNAQPVAGMWKNTHALAMWALRLTRRARHLKVSTLEPMDLFVLARVFQAALNEFQSKIERCPGRWRNQKSQVFRRLMRVRQYIELHCTDTLPIDLLASMANYSRAHFMTVFRSVFDETPHALVLERRLSFAKRMLVQHGMSVREGFEDRSSFSKLFRRRFGVTAMSTRTAP
jgi:AraC family transcriptional regulator